MKIYTATAPNPRRVKIFLAEKGIELEQVEIEIMNGETRTDSFLSLNSLGKAPVLELDDGRVLCESVSICRYLEELFPEPALLGENAFERARIDMWNRRIELEYFQTIGHIAQHTFPFFAGQVEQMPAFAASQKRLALEKHQWLDDELSDGREFLSGNRFSLADITGMVAFDLAQHAGVAVSSDLQHLHAWSQRVRSRESMAA